MVLKGNGASIRVLEKLGFVYESEMQEDGVPGAIYRLKHENWLIK